MLLGHSKALDAYVAEMKKRAQGRGIVRLRKLLDLKRTYPPQAFDNAIEKALQFGLYDLSRLEKMILKDIAGDFFNLK